MLSKWNIIKSKEVFKCPWFSIDQETWKLPKGKTINDCFISNSKDIVSVIPFTEKYKVLVIKEYKHGYKDVIYTFPAGILEKDELPMDGASRELQEETGYIGDLSFIQKTSPNPTSSRFSKYSFIATNIKKVSEQNLDSTEFIEEDIYSIKEVMNLIDSGKIVSDLSICSFYSALRHIGLLDIKT